MQPERRKSSEEVKDGRRDGREILQRFWRRWRWLKRRSRSGGVTREKRLGKRARGGSDLAPFAHSFG